MSEADERAAIIAEARSWIGTPYHNCADVKGAGVDCGMLLVRVMVDTGMVAPFDPRPYSADWHLHRGEERYLGFVHNRAHAVAEPLPGDIALFRIGRCYSHGAIVTIADPLTILHAEVGREWVLEEPLSQNSRLAAPERRVQFFSLFREPA